MLPRPVYKKVLKSLDHYKKQHLEDRAENPGRAPIGWRISIETAISHICRENRVRATPEVVDETIQYLVKNGHLVDYHGDLTFPGEPLPSKEEIKRQALIDLAKLTE